MLVDEIILNHILVNSGQIMWKILQIVFITNISVYQLCKNHTASSIVSTVVLLKWHDFKRKELVAEFITTDILVSSVPNHV